MKKILKRKLFSQYTPPPSHPLFLKKNNSIFQRQKLMSSVFVPENSGSAQQQKQPEQARPKRPRSSLAVSVCIK